MRFKHFIFFLALSSAMMISCNSDNSTIEQENYENTREALLELEQKSPTKFLTVTSQDKKNLLGQTVIKGKLTNTATVAVFKDVTIQLFFYSKTKALLETDTETIFERLEPGQTREFKTKYFAPKGTDSVGLKVMNAKLGD
ncbi:MAG: FxLYD domain-containing protein [Ginsengibacter sp.]